MRNLNYLNKYRVIHPLWGVGNEKNGAFMLPPEITGSDLPIAVIASNGGGWDHVSVSTSKRTPTWEEMQRVKELFFEDDEVVIQIHPAKNDYVNFHPYCLHLWRPQNHEIPLPDVTMV